MAAESSGEDLFIARHFRPLATSPAALGLRDDAALLTPPPGQDLVLTKDALVAGIHFFPDDPPGDIARKALRVNLSDLAAKGAAPLGALLALALPPEADEAFMAAFTTGLKADMEAFGCPLLGGDTVRTTGPLVVSLTALGLVPHRDFVARTTAGPGEAILVSGTIGDSALGLAARLAPARFAGLSAEDRDFLRQRYLRPRPRLELVPILRAHARAAMDVSDGLVGDLAKLLAASGCGGRIEAGRVPLSPAAAAALAGDPTLLETALSGGDDYEIVCTMPHADVGAACAAAQAAGTALHLIGSTRSDAGLDVVDPAGVPLRFTRTSYSHL